jgi:hypothetical protein
MRGRHQMWALFFPEPPGRHRGGFAHGGDVSHVQLGTAVEVGIIEVNSSLEGTIGYASLAFEEVDDLGEHVIEGHG